MSDLEKPALTETPVHVSRKDVHSDLKLAQMFMVAYECELEGG